MQKYTRTKYPFTPVIIYIDFNHNSDEPLSDESKLCKYLNEINIEYYIYYVRNNVL